MTKLDFFESVAADSLMDERNFPLSIRNFLEQEQRLLQSLEERFDVLVEVGCNDGRYLPWAAEQEKTYLGVDVSPRHIAAGNARAKNMGLERHRYRFALGDARNLQALAAHEELVQTQGRVLILFPFGLLGALKDTDRVIDGLAILGHSFVVSLYQTNTETTKVRCDYYARCGIQATASTNKQGVCISSSQGFESIIHHPSYLLERFRQKGMTAAAIAWSTMNLAVVSQSLLPTIPREFSEVALLA